MCDDEDSDGTEYLSTQEEDQYLDMAELALNSVVGLMSNHTMKLRGRIANQDVVVLNDCGATHNFLSNRVVEKLALPLCDTGHYGVITGTGLSVHGIGSYKDVHLSL